jgi:hypothetical protein
MKIETQNLNNPRRPNGRNQKGMTQSPKTYWERVGVSFQELQKPITARGNGSMAFKYDSFQPQGLPFIGR